MVGFKKRIISKQNLSSCLILMGQTAKNIALEILLYHMLYQYLNVNIVWMVTGWDVTFD